MSDTAADWTQIAELVRADTYTLDDRLELPLERQVQVLMDLACARRPEFTRSIPARATDHDIVIHDVLVKMVRAVAAERERCAQVAEDAADKQATLRATLRPVSHPEALADAIAAAIRGGDDAGS